MNLISNGDFETPNYTDQWNVQSCGATCDPGVDDLNPHQGNVAFYSSGKNVTLSQTVSLMPVGQVSLYYFGFWLAYECEGNNHCSIQVFVHIE